MKTVGIVGGGLAGLTCAYRLCPKGLKTIVFEKEALIGGRVPYAGAVATEKYQPRLISLIKELGLEELKVPLKPADIGFYTEEGDFLGAEKMPLLLSRTLSLTEMYRSLKLRRFVNRLRFHPLDPDPKLLELRGLSAKDYFKDFSEKMQKIMIDPNKIFIFEEDLEKVSAEYFLSHVRLGNEFSTGKAFVFEENTVMTVAHVLELKLRQGNCQTFTSAKVLQVKKEGEKFRIFYEKEGQKEELVDQVVLATPLNETAKIFPDLNLETNIKYRKTKCYFADGELKWPKRKFLIGFPGNPANLRALFNVISYNQMVYPWDIEKPVNLEALYTKYSLTSETEIDPAMPIVPPAAKIPELKTEIEGAFLCGDFYWYPWLETAIVTAEKVTEMITQK